MSSDIKRIKREIAGREAADVKRFRAAAREETYPEVRSALDEIANDMGSVLGGQETVGSLMERSRRHELQVCSKCGYRRHPDDQEPKNVCPRCAKYYGEQDWSTSATSSDRGIKKISRTPIGVTKAILQYMLLFALPITWFFAGLDDGKVFLFGTRARFSSGEAASYWLTGTPAIGLRVVIVALFVSLFFMLMSSWSGNSLHRRYGNVLFACVVMLWLVITILGFFGFFELTRVV